MNNLEEKIGYKFKNIGYLKNALTHSSYSNENGIKSNERLEFLGDSVLSIVVSERLFNLYPDKSEGELSKIRSSLVCEGSLFEISKKINLSDHLLLGRGEEENMGRNRHSNVADAFEALIAAIYLDSDFDTVKQWLLGMMNEEIENVSSWKSKDYKTMLQEHTQKGVTGKVTYKILSEFGPPHDKTFVSCVMIDGDMKAEGNGRTKKDSEQDAAKKVLTELGVL